MKEIVKYIGVFFLTVFFFTNKALAAYDLLEYSMPLSSGSYVVERVQSSDGGEWYNKDITGRSVFNGQETISSDYYESHNGGSSFTYEHTSYLSYDDNNIYKHGERDSSGSTICEPPAAIRRSVNIGDSFTIIISCTLPDGSYVSHNETVEILGVEDITVPAGTFQKCLKIHFSTPDQTGVQWWAKGIGEIKKTKIKSTHTNYYEMTDYYIVPESSSNSIPLSAINLLLKDHD